MGLIPTKKWVIYTCTSKRYNKTAIKHKVVIFMIKSVIIIFLLVVNQNLRRKNMVVTSTGILNGVIDDKYGKHGNQFNQNGMPTYSLPLKIENAPKQAKSYAVVLEDKDAFPVSGGFSWIHWTLANLTRTEIMENESQIATDFIQGVNSWTSIQGGSQSKSLSSYYGGMAPPDAPHTYEIHVYALDTMLELENGFLYNQLYHQMDGHILEQYTLKGTYRN